VTSGWPLAVTFSLVSGTLPDDVTLASNGILSGTVAAGQEGDYAPVFRVWNDTGDAVPDATGDVTVTAAPDAPTWGVVTLPTIAEGEGYGALDLDTFISDDGGDASITYLDDGNLPAGIGLSANGTFFGVATTASTGNVVFTATNSGGPTGSASTPWEITAAVTVDGWATEDDFDWLTEDGFRWILE